MAAPFDPPLIPARAVIATMHGKQQVIAPLLLSALGLPSCVPAEFNTDCFGSFSREIARVGSPLDAARAKIAAAFVQVPDACIGVSSEGSFGPHPQIPFLPVDSEIVVLLDRRSGLEVVGHHLTPRTNFAQTVVSEPAAVTDFAKRIGFPAHGAIVIGTCGGQPAPERLLRKSIRTIDELLAAAGEAIAHGGSAHLETDMRAYRNPTRMRAIRRATIDLIRRYRCHCPHCHRPGFVVTERLAGLPCAECCSPTGVTRAQVRVCAGCAYRVENAVAAAAADPGRCDSCNP